MDHDPDERDEHEDEEFDGLAYLGGRYREHDGEFEADEADFFDTWGPTGDRYERNLDDRYGRSLDGLDEEAENG